MTQGKPRTPKTAAQLLELAQEQFDFLLNSADGYDAGRASEVKRIALHVRVLLHHTASSHALLEQTGHRDRLQFMDSAGDLSPTNLVAESPLVSMQFSYDGRGSATGKYVPFFGDWPPNSRPAQTPAEQVTALREGRHPTRRRGTHLPFERWWTANVIKDGEGNHFSRRRLVLALANEEGGAHVDPRTKADYEALANNNSLGWVIWSDWEQRGGKEPSPFGSPIPACIRQIAWEIHRTVYDQAPELLPAELRKPPTQRMH